MHDDHTMQVASPFEPAAVHTAQRGGGEGGARWTGMPVNLTPQEGATRNRLCSMWIFPCRTKIEENVFLQSAEAAILIQAQNISTSLDFCTTTSLLFSLNAETEKMTPK